MFEDRTLEKNEMLSSLPIMGEKGVVSVGKSIGLSSSVMTALKGQDLTTAVFEELDKRGSFPIKTRYFKDIPIGVVGKSASAKRLNDTLDKKGIHPLISKSESLYPFESPETKVDVMKDESFKVRYLTTLDMLNESTTTDLSIMRLFCTNMSYTKEKEMSYSSSIHTFDETFADKPSIDSFFHDWMEGRIETLKSNPTSVATILAMKNVAKKVGSTELDQQVESLLEIANHTYLIPEGFEVKKPADIFRLPPSWRETAVLPSHSCYDAWNDCTSAVTRKMEDGGLSFEEQLSANVLINNKIFTQNPDDVLVANKK